MGYFTEMGIGCRRDPLEANVWYVRAASDGDERAKHRLTAIRAAAAGADAHEAAEYKGVPMEVVPAKASGLKGKKGRKASAKAAEAERLAVGGGQGDGREKGEGGKECVVM